MAPSQPGLNPVSRPPAATAGRQLVVGVASLVGLYLVIFGSAVVNSLRAVFDPASFSRLAAGASSWSSRVAALEGEVFVVAVVLGTALRWLPRGAPDIARRMGLGGRLMRPVPGGMLCAAAAYIAVAMTSGWLGDHLVAALHLSRGSYRGVTHGAGGLFVGTVTAGAAAVTEEIALLALAVAIVDHGWGVLGRRPRWATPATIGLLLVLRWMLHLYYLWGSVFVLFWIPASYGLYRWVGSVWPLVLGHATYDCVLSAEQAYAGLTAVLDRALWLLAAVGAVAVVLSLLRLAPAGRRTHTVVVANTGFAPAALPAPTLLSPRQPRHHR